MKIQETLRDSLNARHACEQACVAAIENCEVSDGIHDLYALRQELQGRRRQRCIYRNHESESSGTALSPPISGLSTTWGRQSLITSTRARPKSTKGCGNSIWSGTSSACLNPRFPVGQPPTVGGKGGRRVGAICPVRVPKAAIGRSSGYHRLGHSGTLKTRSRQVGLCTWRITIRSQRKQPPDGDSTREKAEVLNPKWEA